MPKEEVIPKLIPVFRNCGYEGATVSQLSKATGLKKASLYHYFQGGKEEMAKAVLEYISHWIEEHIFAPLQTEKPALDRLKAMCKGIDEFYQSGQDPCFLAVMSLGEADNLFHQQLEKSLKKWLDTLSAIAEETGIPPQQARENAEDAIITIQGALVLVRVTKDTKVFKRAIAKIPEILLRD